MNLTIKDIGKIANVSTATVSRSLNDSPLVSEATKNRVKEIANQYGFKFNENARSLVKNKTQTVGVVYEPITERLNVELYHFGLQNSIISSFSDQNYDTIIFFPRDKEDQESNIIRFVKQNKIDGLLVHWNDISTEEAEFLNERNFPHLFLHHTPKLQPYDKGSYIVPDHEMGGYLATSHLIKQGASKIFTLTSSQYFEFEQRTLGYKRALEENNLPFVENRVLESFYSFEEGYRLVMENIHSIHHCDAIFAQTDLMAFGAIRALQSKKIRVPQDILVCGYDDTEISRYFIPSLTTIQQPKDQLAQEASLQLIEMINNPDLLQHPKQRLIPPTLVVRESTKY